MSESLNVNTQKFATDANFVTSSDPWSGLPLRVSLPSGVVQQGIAPRQQIPAQYFNGLMGPVCDSLGNLARVQAHSALKSWRNAAPPNASGGVNYTELIGLQTASSFDINGDRELIPVLIGPNSSDTNKAYFLRGTPSLTFESNATRAGTGLGGVTFAFAGEPGAILISNGPVEIVSTDHGGSWATTSTFSGASSSAGGHYAFLSGASHYLVAKYGAFNQVERCATLTGSSSNANLPGGVAINAGTIAEFADDKIANIVLLAHVASNTFASIFWSSDSGATWTKVKDLSGANANISFSDFSGEFVAWDDSGGIYTSLTGQTWTQVSGSADSTRGFVGGRDTFACVGPAIVKVWTYTLPGGSGFTKNGIAYSFDMGSTWNFSAFGATDAGTTLLRLKSFNGRLFAMTGLVLYMSGCLSAPFNEL